MSKEVTNTKHRGRPHIDPAKKAHQYTLTMKPEIHKLAQEEAGRRGISFSSFISSAIVEYFDKEHNDNG